MKKQTFKLKGLTCASCASEIERELQAAGFRSPTVNFPTSEVTFTGDPEKAKAIIKRIEPGVKVLATDEKSDHSQAEDEGHKKMLYFIVPALILFLLGLTFRYWYPISDSLPIVLFGAAYGLVGWKVLRNAGINASHGKFLDENFLLVVATFGAFALQEYPEATGVMLFYVVGEFLQDLAVGRSRRSIQSLLSLKVDYANLKSGDATTKVSLEEVKVGDFIVVKPGERVPLDGVVVEGASTLDTSALTGESVPREIQTGKEILSGMLNLNGLLTVKITKPSEESTLARIFALVQEAATRKAKTEQFITRFARYYTPAVVGLALLVGLIPPLVIGGSFVTWGYRALVLLVISCPCALVLSIPLGYFGGIGRASKEGVLVKGSNFLDALAEVKVVAFDKTGTLTKGVFKVTQVVPEDGYDEEKVLKFAAWAEGGSNHPIATAIRNACGETLPESLISSYEEIAGQGIAAKVGGQRLLVGNDRLLHRYSIPHPTCHIPGTVAHVAIDGHYAGHIIIADELKDDAQEAVRELKKLGVEQVALVTGDNKELANNLAQKLDMDAVYAELLPEEKVKVIEKLEQEKAPGTKIAFVGDGINDAPVIARADIGVAMGALGSDAAIETADVVIMDDHPSKLAEGILVARKTKRIVWQNIVFALSVKLGFIGLGVIGEATMWEAVFADVGVALIAVLNAIRW
jgi:Cd2+/Zn2+-exporting ATPase